VQKENHGGRRRPAEACRSGEGASAPLALSKPPLQFPAAKP